MAHNRRSLTPAHVRPSLGVLLSIVAVAFLTTASAAQLNVSTEGLSTMSADKCSTANMSVHVSPTGFSIGFTKTAVQITNYPAACNGQSITVDVRNASGAQIATGTGTCSASPCVIPTGNYTATSASAAHVFASTWGLSASWDSACGVFLIFMNCT